MTVIERDAEIDISLASLNKLLAEAKWNETVDINLAITKLRAQKILMVTESWDSFKVAITADDFKALQSLKKDMDDATNDAKKKADLVRTGIGIVKKIVTILH
jgi:hypothetical protein